MIDKTKTCISLKIAPCKKKYRPTYRLVIQRLFQLWKQLKMWFSQQRPATSTSHSFDITSHYHLELTRPGIEQRRQNNVSESIPVPSPPHPPRDHGSSCFASMQSAMLMKGFKIISKLLVDLSARKNPFIITLLWELHGESYPWLGSSNCLFIQQHRSTRDTCSTTTKNVPLFFCGCQIVPTHNFFLLFIAVF